LGYEKNVVKRLVAGLCFLF